MHETAERLMDPSVRSRRERRHEIPSELLMTERKKQADSAAGIDDVLARGRSARSNASGRFEAVRTEAFDDGWTECEPAEAARAETTLTVDRAKTILSCNDSPDIGFDRSINPFRGCEHGCIYCFARPTHAYLGLSPGLDFETKLFFKPEAADLVPSRFVLELILARSPA